MQRLYSETMTLIPSFGWTTYKDVKIRLYTVYLPQSAGAGAQADG